MSNWAAWSQLEWTQPWWVLLALQPVLMALLLKMRRAQVMHYAESHLLAWAVRGNTEVRQRKWLLNFGAWFLLGCALAGPRLPLSSVESLQQTKQRHELDIMVLLDVSPSMLAQDISPQRLQRAKLELLDLIPQLHGERLGLIAFSGKAGMVMPLNRDYAALSYYLDIAEPALFDAPGTALASALELALRKLTQDKYVTNSAEKFPHRAILLLTDAETSTLSGAAGAAVWEAADKLKQAGIPLYILGVGTQQGATITQADGNLLVFEGADVISMMDPVGFAELADKTNGKFVPLIEGDAHWRSLYEKGLLGVPGGKVSAENVQAWQQMYAIFLLPALLLLLLNHFPMQLNIKKYLPVPVLLMALVVFGGVPEVYATEADAYAAYHTNNHARAQTLYGDLPGFSARLGEGAAAYRRRDYQYAIRQFASALLGAQNGEQREQALFNLGNSYFMAGNYRAAADAFLGVLKYAQDSQNDLLLQNSRTNLALSAGKLAAVIKPRKNPMGIAGRRGQQTGGALGEDAADKPLSMDPSDDKKDKKLGLGGELADIDKARLRSDEKAVDINSSTIGDGDIAYRAALKKLELAVDQPSVLHKSLLKIEAAREYEPQLEMPPW